MITVWFYIPLKLTVRARFFSPVWCDDQSNKQKGALSWCLISVSGVFPKGQGMVCCYRAHERFMVQVYTPGKVTEMGITVWNEHKPSTSPCHGCCPKHLDSCRSKRFPCYEEQSIFQHIVFLFRCCCLLIWPFFFFLKFTAKSLCFVTY